MCLSSNYGCVQPACPCGTLSFDSRFTACLLYARVWAQGMPPRDAWNLTCRLFVGVLKKNWVWWTPAVIVNMKYAIAPPPPCSLLVRRLVMCLLTLHVLVIGAQVCSIGVQAGVW